MPEAKTAGSAADPAEPIGKDEFMKTDEVKAQSGSGDNTVVFEKVWDLVNAIKEGRLQTRADLKGTSGSDREILEGVNQLLDFIVAPLNVAAEYVDRISKGDIPPAITDSYNGCLLYTSDAADE